jgi:glycosyltransferase involved in cell wall biosynthesis
MPANGQAPVLPVTVIIPAYNRREMVARALSSVRRQTARPAEVIVVDDASEDGTAEAAERLGARVIRHDRNAGTAAARNSGLARATKPWVALLDSDDEWLPHHLETLWLLREGRVLVAGAARIEGAGPGRLTYHGPPGRGGLRLCSPARLVFPGNLIPASGAMVRRDLALELGGFRRPDGVADLDLWLRVLEHGSAEVASTVTVVYHVHPAQMTVDAARMQHGHLVVADRFAGRAWSSPRLLNRWRAWAAWNNLRSAVRQGHARDAAPLGARLAGRPWTWVAIGQGYVFRARLRRRGAELERNGR